MKVNDLTGGIITSAMKVHTLLGPGLLESVYERCLAHELRKAGLRVASQLPLAVMYDGEVIDGGYRIDLLVEDTVIVEVKSGRKHSARIFSTTDALPEVKRQTRGFADQLQHSSPAQWHSPHCERKSTRRN